MSKTYSFFPNFKRRLISGLFALLPLFLTIMILKYVLNLIGSQTEPVIRSLGEWFLPEAFSSFLLGHEKLIILPLSILIGLLFLVLIGLFAEKGLKKFLDKAFRRIPLVASLYSSIKQVLDVMDTQGSKNSGMFQRACLVKISDKVEALGFVTSIMKDQSTGASLVSVYVPMPPNPTSGMIFMVDTSQVRKIDWPTESTMRTVVSGGLLAPSEISFKDFDWAELKNKGDS